MGVSLGLKNRLSVGLGYGCKMAPGGEEAGMGVTWGLALKPARPILPWADISLPYLSVKQSPPFLLSSLPSFLPSFPSFLPLSSN